MLDWHADRDSSLDHIRARYHHFAAVEARAVAPHYAALAQRVAESEPLLRFLAALPAPKQQPNLLFAAVRSLYGIPADGQALDRVVEQHADEIRRVMLQRNTQTNEPARCATLLPALARLAPPLALLEVGASAGLCLLPDRWGYDYGRVRLEPRVRTAHPAPVFPCRASAATPLPDTNPDVVWRAGLDLNPLRLGDAADVDWLEALVWPGQPERAARLRTAIEVARVDPPFVQTGNLVTDLHALAATAPGAATLVVFHSAVLAYVTPADRERFVRAVRELDAVWISNEAPGVLPDVAAQLADEPSADRFVLAVDGTPVALTAPHGQAIDWLA